MTLFKNQQSKLFGGRSNLNNKKLKLTGEKTLITGRKRHFLDNTDDRIKQPSIPVFDKIITESGFSIITELGDFIIPEL